MDEDIVVSSIEDFADMQVREPTKRRNELYKTIVEYSLEGVYLRSFQTAAEAGKFYNMKGSSVSNICRGLYPYCGKTKTIFLYRGDDIMERLKTINQKVKDLSKHATKCKETYEYTLGGRLLFIWPTAKLAAKTYDINYKIICKCCKGKRLFIDKRIFLYADGDIKQRVREVKAELYRLSKKRPKYREVDEYTLNGKFVKGHPSASAASKVLDIHVSDITRCCNGNDASGNHYTAKGRIFLWIGDSIKERLELIKQKKK